MCAAHAFCLLDVLLLLWLHQLVSDTVYALSPNSLVQCMCACDACLLSCHLWRYDFAAAAPPGGAWIAACRRPPLHVASARVYLRRVASAGLRPD